MSYIGNSPANCGNYQIVDDIASSFNGTTTSFALTASSQAITPVKSGQLLVSLNGVLQEPDDTGTDGFKVSGSNIVFSSAPASGSTFWCVYQGQNVDIGTPSAGTVGTTQMSYPLANFTSTGIDDNATSTKFTVSDTGIDVTGTVTADGLAVEGTGSCGTFGNSTDNSSIISLEFNAGADGSGKLMRAGSTYSPAVNYEGWMADSFIIRADDNLSNGLGLFAEHTSGTIRMYTGGSGSSKLRQKIEASGDISFYEDTGTTAKFFWDASAESLGIGGIPENELDVRGTVEIGNGSTNRMYLGYSGSDFRLYDRAATTERMRIDSSGNVGIGTSTPTSGSKLDVNGAIACNNFIPDYTATVNATWTTSTVIVPTGTFTHGSTYIVEFRIGSYGAQPYYLYGSTLVTAASANGSWNGSEVEIVATTHTGNSYSMHVRSYGGANIVSGVKLRVNSAGATGNAVDCVVSAKRIL